jgi:hypothetical protein
LEGIFDKKANAPGLAGHGETRLLTWHVKGNLFLTGHPIDARRLGKFRRAGQSQISTGVPGCPGYPENY